MTAMSPLATRLGTATPDSADGSFTEDSDFANSRQQTPSPSRTGSETPARESPSTTVTASSFAPAGLAGLSTTVTYSGTSAVTSDVGDDGVLHIRPVPTRKGRKVKVKKVVNFVPRISTFDRFHTAEQTQSFWGFYVLFWLMMSLVLVRMFYHSYLNSGVVVGLRFAKLISADGVTLALSDAALVGTTVLAVPFVQLMQHGWIRYRGMGVVIQHFGQAVLLATAIRWTFYRQWYWVQSGYLTLHTLVMLMKTHSYIAYNGQLSESKRQLRKKTAELDQAVEKSGGWRTVLSEASKLHASTIASPLSGNAEVPDMDTAIAPRTLLRRRRSSAIEKDDPPLSPLPPDNAGDMKDPRRLIDYPDEEIYNLANDCVDLQEDITSTGREGIVWPANVTYTNYIDYLLIPTLVYELEYPRTSSIRPIYVLEKTLATFGTFFVLYAITEHIILPTHEAAKTNAIRNENFVLTALDLVLPFMVNYLLIFYIIFECVCNGFAELTRFADRGFYEDWWNAVTWEEFARKWNKPVHQFLLRHVYASTIAAFRLSKFQASFLTFLLSAAIHELVMAIVSKKFRLYLFLMQMCQLPLIMAGRLPLMRKHPLAGNLFFWLGLVSGFPLLAIGYAEEIRQFGLN